jgi:hypothetical protein
VRDRLEEMPNFATELDLVNAEDGNTIEASMNKKLAKKYQTKLNAQDDKLFSHFAKHGINVGKLYTSDDAFIKVVSNPTLMSNLKDIKPIVSIADDSLSYLLMVIAVLLIVAFFIRSNY